MISPSFVWLPPADCPEPELFPAEPDPQPPTIKNSTSHARPKVVLLATAGTKRTLLPGDATSRLLDRANSIDVGRARDTAGSTGQSGSRHAGATRLNATSVQPGSPLSHCKRQSSAK